MLQSKILKQKIKEIKELIDKSGQSFQECRNSSHKPLDLLVLLILNQSTTDSLADRAFAQLKAVYPNYQTLLLEGDLQKIEETIAVCGLAKSKSEYILILLQHLESKGLLDLNLPFINELDDRAALTFLTSIRGIGIKSACCLLLFSFNRGVFPLDTHILRVLKRIGILEANCASEKAHKLMEQVVAKSDCLILHLALIETGRKICFSRKPLCKGCLFNPVCLFAKQHFDNL